MNTPSRFKFQEFKHQIHITDNNRGYLKGQLLALPMQAIAGVHQQ